jgi:hypothetical protein
MIHMGRFDDVSPVWDWEVQEMHSDAGKELRCFNNFAVDWHLVAGSRASLWD